MADLTENLVRTFIIILLTHLLWAIPALAQTNLEGGSLIRHQQPDSTHPTIFRPVSLADSTGSYALGLRDGQLAAGYYHNADGWATGGVFAGVFFSLIGTGVACAVASGGNTTPPPSELMRISHSPSDYQMAYLDAYSKAAKSSNLNNALMGGLGGYCSRNYNHRRD